MLAGDVLLVLEGEGGSGETGGGDAIPLLNGDWAKLGLNPVKSRDITIRLNTTEYRIRDTRLWTGVYAPVLCMAL